jgi:hypothetical protein
MCPTCKTATALLFVTSSSDSLLTHSLRHVLSIQLSQIVLYRACVLRAEILGAVFSQLDGGLLPDHLRKLLLQPEAHTRRYNKGLWLH